MKKLPCKHEECAHRRAHHDRPDEERGIQYVEVPDNVSDQVPAFCSMTCAIMDGWMTLKYETPEETEVRRSRWREKQRIRNEQQGQKEAVR